MREIVHKFKCQNLRAGAPELARLLAVYMESNQRSPEVLMPVPLHAQRERQRGYNQSELLAREVSKLTGVPMETRVLRRTRNTPPQVAMKSYEERRRNIERAFESRSDVDGQSILLIDDVVTTGSTMSACAEALKATGARWVWGLALARQG